MDRLTITIVGQDLFKIVEQKLISLELTEANEVNHSMLGNLKMLTYSYDLEECEIIRIRTSLLRMIGEDHCRLMAFFQAGNWMRIVVMRPI